MRHIYRDGRVVVEGVVPHEHLHSLDNTKLVQDARSPHGERTDRPLNYNQGILQQEP